MEQQLKVGGWSNPRYGKVQGGRILFEVMWLGCACGTCYGRLDAVRDRMEKANGSVKSWRTVEMTVPARFPIPSVVLEVEPKEMPAQVHTYLSDLLGLQISVC